MKITELAVNLRTGVLVLTALATLGGLGAYVAIPKESNPSIEIPYIVVTTIYPGASPRDVERLITQPIEQEVKAIGDIEEIRSTSVEGVSSIVVEFTPDVSISDAKQNVRDKVDRAKPDLPSDAEDPIISEIDFSEFPIMTVNLAAPYSLTRLKKVAEALEEEIEGIPGVLEVNLVGTLEREVQVDVDRLKLEATGLGFEDVRGSILNENVNLPGGSVDVEDLNYLVRVDGQFDEPREIMDLVVKETPSGPIYMRDLATVDFGFKERSSYARLKVIRTQEDGEELELAEDTGYLQVISLSVKKRSGENILEVAAALKSLMKTFPLPEGTEVLITGDQSKQVKDLVKDLENNIISGIIFVVAVLLFFLGLRNAMLVGVAIPLSMCVSFILFLASGETLNFVILFSLIIALGMLVDNAVVIVENIYRYKEQGASAWEAARKGTGEVGMAVVASTATTVAVFVPMLFWPGLIGKFMGFLPLTLIITLSASLFVALIMNPVITGFLVRVEGQEPEHGPVAGWVRIVGIISVCMLAAVIGLSNPTTLAVLTVGVVGLAVGWRFVFKPIADGFVSKGLPRLIGMYRRFLTAMLERDYTVRWAYARNMFSLVCVTLGAILGILGGVAYGAFGPMSANVLLLPAAVLGGLGVGGIILHTLEAMFVAGMGVVKFGLGFAAFMGGLLGVISLGKEISQQEVITLMALPALVVVVGALGAIINRRGRKLILTDNRALLLNGVLGSLFAIIGVFAAAPTGVAFFPDTDPNQIQVVIEGALGTNIEASNGMSGVAQQRLEDLLKKFPDSEGNVKNVLVGVGVGTSGPDGSSTAASPERSRISLNMVDFNDRTEASRLTLTRIRDELAGLPGAEIEIQRDQAGPPTGAPVNIELTGPDFSVLARIANEIKRTLKEGVEQKKIVGLVDLRDDLDEGRPELKVIIDRERAARAGLSTGLIASTVRTAINGAETSTWRDGEDEYDITVRLQKADRDSLESVRQLRIFKEGKQIPLASVAEVKVTSGLGSITRIDLNRTVSVRGDAAPGMNGQAVLAQVQAYLADYRAQLPDGYSITYTGESEDQQKSFGFLTNALLIGVALIFMILIAQFNSIGYPFIIMLAVGLSLIGVLLGLQLTRSPFGLFTFIGVISLAGIVVNNNIVLIDYTLQLRDRGMARKEAIVEAGATRLRPVLLTALTTVLGLIPLTFGINIDFVGLIAEAKPDFQVGSANTQFWGPMGTAIISGLVFATFLTLVIVPVMFSVFDSVGQAMARAFGRTPVASGQDSVLGEESEGVPPSVT